MCSLTKLAKNAILRSGAFLVSSIFHLSRLNGIMCNKLYQAYLKRVSSQWKIKSHLAFCSHSKPLKQ